MENNASGVAAGCAVWKQFQNGDANALARIFSENYDSLCHYGKKLVRDEALVQDCVQNIFVKIWIRREKLMAVKYVKPYLLKALRRHIGDQIAVLNRKKALQEQFLFEFDIIFSHEDFLIDLHVSAEQSRAVAQCLNGLSSRQREAVFLKFYEGLDYMKIAEVMALNVQSVRNLIHQSLKSIKKQMTDRSTVVINIESRSR